MDAYGALALQNGLVALPADFDETATYPLALWKSDHFGAVTSLAWTQNDQDDAVPVIWNAHYVRDGETWERRGQRIGAPLVGDGISLEAGIQAQLDGRAITASSWMETGQDGSERDSPALIVRGWHSPLVTEMTLVQASSSYSFSANGHRGAWVVGSELVEPWYIEARDARGELVDSTDKRTWMR
jgi:hypothetical protein